LFASRKKYEFYIKTVEFLGFIVSTEGVSIDRSRVDAIEAWPTPVSYYEV